MFTGDSSGDWLAKVMYKTGFASIPTSQTKEDGLTLSNAYITAAVRCAPPQNKPTKEEMQECHSFLEQEFQILSNVTTILCLGKIAYDATCKLLNVKPGKFGHNQVFKYENIKLSHHIIHQSKIHKQEDYYGKIGMQFSKEQKNRVHNYVNQKFKLIR